MSTTPDQATMEHPSLLDDIILHENDLTEKAKSCFGYHSKILHAFELYRRSILSNEHMTSTGKHGALAGVGKMHTNCKRVLNYMAEHNELLNGNLPPLGPLIICGLPRTGSTLLQNLLACDPDCRSPLFTDMCVEIVPPISRSNAVEQKKRMTALQLSMQQDTSFVTQRNQIIASHPVFPIEEDYHILRQASFLPFFTMITSDPVSDDDTWLLEELNKDFAYDYHEVFLRMLNSVDAPRSHWVLKAPVHCFKQDTILQHYPNAAIIVTHRCLDEVLPSLCSTAWSLGSIYLDKRDAASRNTIKKQTLQFIDKAVECMVEFRTRLDRMHDQKRKNLFDVAYNDLMEQPIATVRRIYDYFGLRWSDEFEGAMQAWLSNNPQGKQGRHSYSLVDCELTHEDIETRYTDYINLFQCSSSTDIASTNSN
ncbi:unnamed protein product [Adineta steineri]|uniref:Sulfotransferase n=1 Tax=Adineta steineri TaxID=433720 RepID=A0A814J003_9BILA|nr:unnamed protein product [Adineta steineri]